MKFCQLHLREIKNLHLAVWSILLPLLVAYILRWFGHVARMGEERWVYRFLLGKPGGRRPLGRPGRRWVDNIRMDLQEVECGLWNR